jgi:putative ABC transport system permease protein
MTNFLQDLKFALRMLRKSPGFAAIAIITLALGIGVNSAIFSVVDAVLLRPLPFREPDRVLSIYPDYSAMNTRGATSPLNLMDYRRESTSFEQIAATAPGGATITDVGEAERVKALRVTANFFSTLGIDAARGRTFAGNEDQPGQDGVVVISHNLWLRRFGGDPQILGRNISINSQQRAIIGIMPAGFTWGYSYGKEGQAELWLPLSFTPAALAPSARGNQFLDVYARLKPGVTLAQAQADIDGINRELQKLYPQYYPAASGARSTIKVLKEELTAGVRPALLVLLTTVGFVLLIACSNVANLLMARASVRQKEIAIRTALGASRVRIIRQLLTESSVLALIAGLAGTLAGVWTVQALAIGSALAIPRLTTIALDSRVFLFSLAISAITGLLFGLAPALQVTRTDVNESLKDGTRGSHAHARHGLREVLVVSQIAVALLLLTGAGLLLTSFYRLIHVDPGFKSESVLTARIDLPRARYQTNEQRNLFFQRTQQEIAAIGGVTEVGAIAELPLGGNTNSGSFEIEGQPASTSTDGPHADWWEATPGYFTAIGIPLKAGRYFTDEDRFGMPNVVIVSEGLAKKYFPGQDVIGRRIDFLGEVGKPNWSTIIGVVSDVKQRGLDDRNRAQFYAPYRQTNFASGLTFVARTGTDPNSVANAIRAAVQRIDSQLAVYDIRTMEQVASKSVAERRFTTLLLVTFAGLALVLACIGLYGVIAYSVTQRTQEIGIRMALGAQARDVLRMILSQSLKLTAIGLIVGSIASIALTRFIGNLLFEVKPTDPITLVSVSLLLAVVSLVASYIPAHRAARVNPMVALRYE